MKKVALAIFAAITLVSCSNKPSTEQIELSVKEGFQEQTHYTVSSVQLIKKETYLYAGYVTLEKDNSQAEVEVNIDKDDPTRFIWKVTQPSPTMVKDAMAKVNDELQSKSDSVINVSKLRDKQEYDSLMKAIQLQPESDDL